MKAHRKAIERHYRGRMWVEGFESVKVDGETLQQPVWVIEDQPCYLQRRQERAVDSDGIKSSISYFAKLLYAPEIEIKPGSRVKVVQDNVTTQFKRTGEPFAYPTHHELVINRSDLA